MKLVIAGQKEQVVRLKLVQCGSAVELVAVDERDKIVPSGHLLVIESEGTISRHSCVSDELGFDLDDNGYIRIV